MPSKLVIVESPAKAKTIEKFLGKDYFVLSSLGHVRDLAKSGKFGLGVDLEDNFKPNYVVVSQRKKTLEELKKKAAKAEKIIIATDPDREGEAIGWHLYDAMQLNKKNSQRVVFNEITKEAIQKAIAKPRDLDQNLVHSQETRRILDRIIGFRLSKLMQAKTAGKSAGRVQSVALKLIVDREREIEKFQAEEYWSVTAIFNDFEADLAKYKNKKIKLENEVAAQKVIDSLKSSFEIASVTEQEKKRQAKMPFITSTFQQLASTKLGMNSKKAMQTAQSLYEGVDIGSETVGLITYMRTDSTRMANEFVKETFNFIEKKYGKNYLGIVRNVKSKNKSQDAHEAIRPTNINKTPESIKQYLTTEEYKIYKLIYERTLAALMAPALVKNTTVLLENNDYEFKATGNVMIFDGYLKVYKDYEDNKETILPDLAQYQSKVLVAKDVIKEQHFTKPPARYSEAKLIKEMEELGIGRPSTYAMTMETLRNRNYVQLLEKQFHPTDVGFEITDKLQEIFSNIINVEYTAKMENDLDQIAEGEMIWHELLKNFYDEFALLIDKGFNELEKKEPIKVGRNCPECGNELVKRNGKYGEFIGCSNYPACKYLEADKNKEVCDCPNCEGKIVERKTKRGKVFYGCNKFPKCKTAYWDKPTGEKCPNCDKVLLEKKDKINCESCDYSN